MDIYDHVAISTVESPSPDNNYTREQILVNEIDPIEVTSIVEAEGIYIVKGVSYNTGDSATYFLAADTMVGLWAV